MDSDYKDVLCAVISNIDKFQPNFESLEDMANWVGEDIPETLSGQINLSNKCFAVLATSVTEEILKLCPKNSF